MFPFFFSKAMWFYLKKAEFDLIKFAHTTAKVMTICCLENTVPATSFLKNKPMVGGLGRGFTPKPAGGGHAGKIAGRDHADTSLSGGGSYKLRGFFWIDGLRDRPKMFLTESLFICISFFSYLLFNWSFHFQPG